MRLALTAILTACMMLGGMGVSLKSGPQNPYYETMRFGIFGGESFGLQSEAGEYECMGAGSWPALPWALSTALMLEVWTVALGMSLVVCTDSSGDLGSWDTSILYGNGIRTTNYIKPTGTRWVVRKLTCFSYGTAPVTVNSLDSMEFRLGWQNKTATGVTADPTISIGLGSAINTNASADLSFEVGTKDTIAGLVAMFKIAEGASGTHATTQLKLGCSALVEVS